MKLLGLRKFIRTTLVEMPVGKSPGWGSRDVDTRYPHIKELAHEIDSIFQEWNIKASVDMFDSGYVGISIKFTDAQGTPQKWLVVDQPGKVGREDQSMGYIFFGPGGPIEKSRAWVYEEVPYSGRKFGDTNMRDDARQQTYDAIIDTVDSMMRTPNKNESMLRRYVRQKLLKEEMAQIIQNPYEDVDDYNVLANYALTGDIAGALADPALRPYVEKNEMGWVADEAIGWFNNVGKEGYDMPAPEGWDKNKAHQFLRDIEDAAYQEYAKAAKAAIQNDPDREFLEFLGNQWTSSIEPSDMEDIKWKEYKKYIRLKPPRSISHGVGEIHITKEDTENLYPGAYEDFKDFLTTRAGGQLGKRKPYKKSPPPYYD